MFKLNRMTDYGIVVMAHLAKHEGAVRTAPEIAEATGLGRPTVAKLLKMLTHAGLAVSHRGAHGGYTLVRPIAEISIADAIEALEGPFGLTACVSGAHEACDRQRVCPISGRWDRVNLAIREALDRLTLADVVRPAQTLAPRLAPIVDIEEKSDRLAVVDS
jgi:FeS assembly SUF system regulator